MTPSAWPVVTGSAALESRSKPPGRAVDRQAELEQLEEQPPLGRLGHGEAAPGRRRRRRRAACASARTRAQRPGPATPLQPISPRFAHAVPERRERRARPSRRPSSVAAVQAVRALEGDEVPADRAREGAHRSARPVLREDERRLEGVDAVQRGVGRAPAVLLVGRGHERVRPAAAAAAAGTPSRP